jgi:hypothetical protein
MSVMNKRTHWAGLLVLGLIGLTMASMAWAYPWPLAPMDVQHNVSATFGECRQDRHHFHDGTDIPLGYGGAVLSVADGNVLTIDPSGANAYIRVGRYCYVHVDPNPDLHVGDPVQTGDVVGTTNDQSHIHFKDGGGASGTTIINALRPGGLTPFEDTYPPTVLTIKFYQNATTQIFPTPKISGLVDIVSRSYDRTDNSSYGGNNGVYSIGYEVFAADETTTVQGPSFPYTFDTIPSSYYIRNVYFQGSSTSTYYYIVTNQITHDSWWDTRLVDPGHYKVSVYCCDTRDNWDTTSVWVEVAEQDVMPPEVPVLKSVTGTRDNQFTVTWQPSQDEELKGYRLYHSFEAETWLSNYDEEDLPDTSFQLETSGFQNDWAIYFKLSAVDTAAVPNESDASDSYGTRLTDIGAKILVVDGFDRTSDSWTETSHPFTLSHARALDAHGMAFDCCANEAVLDSSVLLDGYDAVVWVLGDEGVEDSTFSPVEQILVTNYLEGGGKLFLSGSEVGYDLVELGSTEDESFYNQILHADYVTDDAQVNDVSGLPGSIFEGLSFSFDDGTHGIYQENYPDAINARNSSIANLTYTGTAYNAGLQYQGTFGLGTQEGRLVYLGFPFETIYPESTRTVVMSRILQFFDLTTPVELKSDDRAGVPGEFVLHQNYPNPFNPTTTITFCLPAGGTRQTTLRIFNVLGQQVRTLVDTPLDPGRHKVTWAGRDERDHPVSSGVYFFVLQADSYTETRKMVLLR